MKNDNISKYKRYLNRLKYNQYLENKDNNNNYLINSDTDINTQPIDLDLLYDLDNESLESSDDKHWYENIWEGVKNIGSDFGSDVKNTHRMGMNQIAEGNVDRKFQSLIDLHTEQEDLRKIKEYQDAVKLRNRLIQLMESDDFDPKDLQQINTLLNPALKTILKFEEYALGEGRTHNAIAEFMYDNSRLDVGDAFKMWGKEIARAGRGEHGDAEDLIKSFPRMAMRGIQSAADAGVTAYKWILDLYKSGDGDVRNSENALEYIKRSKDPNDPYVRKMFRGDSIIDSSVGRRVDQRLYEIKREEEQKVAELQSAQQFAKDGIGLFGIDWFDYEDVPELFKKDYEKYQKEGGFFSPVLHPLYGGIDMAFTIGQLHHDIKQMAVDGGARWLIKHLPAFAGGWKKKAMSTVATAITGADVAFGVREQMISREEETLNEAITSMAERVAAEAAAAGADLDKILDATRAAAQKLNINTEDFGEDKMIKLALALGVDTGDPIWNAAAKRASRGINKLINANNALSISDYAQSLPFMSYWGDGVMRAKKYLLGAEGTTPKIMPDVENTIRRFTDWTVDKAAKQFFKRDMPKAALKVKRIGDYAMQKAMLTAYEGALEAGEEGVQGLLSNRYKRGEYDDYNRDANILPFEELVENPTIAATAFLDYLGLGFYDPDNGDLQLRKEMNSGFWTSGMFSNGLHLLTNFRKNRTDNMRGLINQMKDDKALLSIIAGQQKALQDQVHLEQFYNAFEAGRTWNGMVDALNELKKGVSKENSIVTEEDVEADTKLLSAMWFMYNNQELAQEMKDAGIVEHSDDHKLLMINGAKALVDAQMTTELVDKQNLELIQDRSNRVEAIKNINSILSKIEELSARDNLTSEDAELLQTLNNRIELQEKEDPKLIDIVKKIRSSHESFLKHRANADYRKNALNRYKNTFYKNGKLDQKAFENDANVKQAIKELQVLPLQLERTASEGYDLLVNRILNRSFLISNEARFRNSIKSKKDFVKNTYLGTHLQNTEGFDVDIRRRLAEIYDNEEQREQFVNNVIDSLDDDKIIEFQDVNKDVWVGRVAEMMDAYKRASTLQKLSKQFRNQQMLLWAIRRETGLDLDISGIKGISDYLEDGLKEITKNIDTYREFLETHGLEDAEYGDDSDYKKKFAILSLNKAVQKAQQEVALAYFGRNTNPKALAEAVFGRAGAPEELSNIIAQFDKISASSAAKSELDRLVTEEETNKHDLEKLSRDAAWDIIKRQLKDSKKRKRIARRRFFEDVISDIEDSAETQSESTEQQESEEDLTKPSTGEVEISKAEKDLRKKYNHEKDKKSVDQKIKEAEEKAKKVSDNQKESQKDADPIDKDKDPKDAGKEQIPDPAEDKKAEVAAEAVGLDPAGGTNIPDAPIQAGSYGDPLDDAIETAIPPKDDTLSDDLEDDDVTGTPMSDDDTDVETSDEDDVTENEIDDEDDVIENEIDDEDDVTGTTMYHEADVTVDLVTDDVYDNLDGDDRASVDEDVNGQLDADINGTIPTQQLPGVNNRQDPKSIVGELPIDLYWLTCFYKHKLEDGEVEEIPIIKTPKGPITEINGKKIKSGIKLGKKLLQRGWLSTTKQYYIVTQSEQSKNVKEGEDIRDTFTVALCIEDNDSVYVTFYKQLGKENSEDSLGKIWSVDKEQQLRNSLYLRDMDVSAVEQYVEKNSDLRKLTRKKDESDEHFEYRRNSDLVSKYRFAVNDFAYQRWLEDMARSGINTGYKITYDEKTGRYESKFAHQEWFSGRSQIPQDIRNNYNKLARRYFSKFNKQGRWKNQEVYSEQQIEDEIQKLRQQRNAVIDAYLEKNEKNLYIFPEDVLPDKVHPVYISLSNGSIEINKDPKTNSRKFRNVVNKNNSIEDILSKIDSGELVFGFGRGFRPKQGGAWNIVSLGDASDVLCEDGGYAGKIYMVVTGPGDSAIPVPIMLREARINQQQRVGKDSTSTNYLNQNRKAKLCLKMNPKTGKLENVDPEYKPTFAEVILNMILGQISLPTSAQITTDDFVRLFLHCDPGTIIDGDISDEKARELFESKQFAYTAGVELTSYKDATGKVVMKKLEKAGEKKLYIAIKNEEGKYELKSYTKEQVLKDDSIRLQIVQAMSMQLHWNTDAVSFYENLSPTTYSDALGRLVKSLVDEDSRNGRFKDMSLDEFLEQTVSLCDCPQLQFKIGDFYKKGDTDQIEDIQPVKGSVLAWMLKTGKLTTDSTELIFYAPFVYASGVKENEQSSEEAELKEELEENATLKIELPVENQQQGFFDQSAMEAVEDNLEDDIDLILIAKNESERKLKLENVKRMFEDDNYAMDKYFPIDKTEELLDFIVMQPIEADSNEDYRDEKEQRLKLFIDKYNLIHKTDLKYSDIQDNGKGISRLKAYDCIIVYKDDKGNTNIKCVSIAKSARLNKTRQVDTERLLNSATGVFSTTESSSTMDEASARLWLEDKLGIDQENVYVQDAALRTLANGRHVYGLVNLAFDAILKDTVGVIQLSTSGGRGVHYHEAFHYVNLLMNSPMRRKSIYLDYYERNKDKYGDNAPTNRQIEEDLAEDFRTWMEIRNPNTLFGKVRKFFSGIFDLLIASRTQGYKQMFVDINAGRYNIKKNPKLMLDKQSMLEFKKQYPNGVKLEYYIPLTDEQDRAADEFITHDEILDAQSAIGRFVLQSINIQSSKDITDATGKDFDEILNEINKWIDDLEKQDEQIAERLRRVVKNKEFTKKAIRNAFASISVESNISQKTKRVKNETDPAGNVKAADAFEDPTKRENYTDVAFDRFDLKISKKTNAAFEVKLFLMQMPIAKYQMSKDKPGEREIVYDIDDYGLKKMEDFRVVWNKLSSLLWTCTSVDEKDANGEKYLESSILGKLEKEAKYDAFFKVAFDRIQKLDTGSIKNIILKSQIYSTMNSSNPQVSQLVISNPLMKGGGSIDDALYDDLGMDMEEQELFSDRDRKFLLLNDNSYKAAMNLPRKWSQRLSSTGMQTVNKDGDIVVNPMFTDALKTKLSELQAEITKVYLNKNLSKAQVEEYIMPLRKLISDLLSEVGIDADENIVRVWMEQYKHDMDPKQEIKWMYGKFCINPGEESGTSILHIFRRIIASANNKSVILTKQSNRERALDEIFNNLDETTDVYKLATAHGKVRPSSQEFSITGPSGETYYPIGMNNSITSECTKLSTDGGLAAARKQKSPYCNHCAILDRAKSADPNNKDTHITPNAFVGVADWNSREGEDYFEISPMEDYVTKMFLILQNHIVLPTMADKKTYYSLYVPGLNLPHDTVRTTIPDEYLKKHVVPVYVKYMNEHDIAYDNGVIDRLWKNFYNDRGLLSLEDKALIDAAAISEINADPKTSYKKFSTTTLTTFCEYFLDELNACLTYYSKDNIERVTKNTTLLRSNYHGDIESYNHQTRMKFGGNGGLFRYMYDLLPENLNMQLEFLWKLLRKIEDGNVKDLSDDNGENVISRSSLIPEGSNGQLTGFELVYKYLNNIKKQYFVNGAPTNELLDLMNKKLILMVDEEMEMLSAPNSPSKLVTKTGDGRYIPRAIPTQLLLPYADSVTGKHQDAVYGKEEFLEDALYSLIASNVVGTMMSIIEFEKVFAGDPAFFKWKREENAVKISGGFEFEDGSKCKEDISVSVVYDAYSDKIKRLGSLLSPGDLVRTQYSDAELKKHPDLAVKQYTNLVIKDAHVKSSVLDSHIIPFFEKQLYIDYLRSRHEDELKTIASANNITITSLLEKAFYEDDKDLYKQVTSLLSAVELDRINKDLGRLIHPYGDINVSDAQVLIRPAFYRRIRIGLGTWSKKDEEAYWILEGKNSDGDWLDGIDDKKIQKAISQLSIYPLKMSYYTNDRDGKLPYNVPVLNKQAIFPAFKFLMTSKSGQSLYRRMNMALNEIDCISFESAVKVGSHQQIPNAIENGNVGDISKELFRKNATSIVYTANDERGPVGKVLPAKINSRKEAKQFLPIQVLNIVDLRMQLNTAPHDANERSLGTQMFKIAFSNIIEDIYYNGRLGSDLRKDVMRCIGILTHLGQLDLLNRFFLHSGDIYTIKEDEVKTFINDIIQNLGLGVSAEDLIRNNNPISCLMTRKIFEHSVFSLVTKEIVDIKTQGGTAIQLSVFGFVDLDNQDVSDDLSSKYRKYNDGKPLLWSVEDGSMEVLLSIKFFDKVLPKDLRDAGYNKKRKWLIEHDIIKGLKEDGSWSSPSPFGVGYRIPTQGLSSMFAFVVADVLPEQSGDLIIVPEEFTAQTGSDFDVDKLYISTFHYKNGEKEQEDKTEGAANTRGAIANTLLQDYIDIITDKHNYADARASIDVFTKILKESVVNPLSQDDKSSYSLGMLQLLPSFLLLKKREFMTGKSGIGPFALNITNLALTQFSHLTINYKKEDSIYKFGSLDAITGKDGRRISGWLSAMVNAHVDVAKDPYIFILNINSATYKYTNFLLRSGYGLGTFTFLTQESIRGFAEELITRDGIYGGNLDGSSDESEYYASLKSRAILKQAEVIAKNLKSLIENLGDEKVDKDLLQSAVRYAEHLTKSNYKREKEILEFESANKDKEDQKINHPEYYKMFVKQNKRLGKDDERFEKDFVQHVDEVFDSKKGMAIRAKKDGSIKDQIVYWRYQLNCLIALEDISPYADALSSLVKKSQIDTKKFGNDFAKLYNFINNLENFKESSNMFTLNVPGFNKNANGKAKSRSDLSSEALETYFGEMFLNDKLYTTLEACVNILQDQMIPATLYYRNLTSEVCKSLFGSTRKGTGYNDIDNEDVLESVYDCVDNLVRFKMLHSRLNSDPSEQYPLDLTCGGNFKTLINRINTIINGDSENNIDPLYKRLAKFQNKMKKMSSKLLKKEYIDILDGKDKFSNEFIKMLVPEGPGRKYPVGRVTLYRSLIDIGDQEEAKLISAFSQLLSSTNEEVRTLAEDLVFYTYYTMYDQNLKNSFFCLVPAPYRKQYDDAIQSGLNAVNSVDMEDGVDLPESLINKDSFVDTVCRNYWYQEGLIKQFYYKLKDARSDFGGGTKKGCLLSKRFSTIERSKGAFPAWFATNNVSKDIMYQKVVKNGTVVIYRKIGTVYRHTENSDEGNYYIFAAVPKAGVHSGSVNNYELYCDYGVESIYEQNRLPYEFNHELTREEVEQLMELQDPKKLGLSSIKLEWLDKTVPYAYSHNSLRSYLEPSYSANNQTIGSCNIVFSNTPKHPDYNGYLLQRGSAVIINFVSDEDDLSKPFSNISPKELEKVINININSEISDEDINKMLEVLKDPNNPSTGVFITKTPSARLNVTQEDIEQYLSQTELSDKLKEKLQKPENKELLEAAVRKFKLGSKLIRLSDRLNPNDMFSDFKFNTFWKGGYTHKDGYLKNHDIVDAIIFAKTNGTSVKSAQIGINYDAKYDKSLNKLLLSLAFLYISGASKITQPVEDSIKLAIVSQELAEQHAMEAIANEDLTNEDAEGADFDDDEYGDVSNDDAEEADFDDDNPALKESANSNKHEGC